MHIIHTMINSMEFYLLSIRATKDFTVIPYITLKMEASRSSKTLVSYFNITRHWRPWLECLLP